MGRLHVLRLPGYRLLLAEHVPDAFLNALDTAKTQADAGGTRDIFASLEEEKLKDEYIRRAFPNVESMYSTLLRIMGCLPMHWDSRFGPEQDEAYGFLVRAPRGELDVALRAAAQSKDKNERQGAARLIFSQHYMTIHEKTDRDIETWMSVLAEAAYDDPFPENRRLVLYRLAKHPSARALNVLEKAVQDSDQTVRRYALEALSLRRNSKATLILSRVAKGLTCPGIAADLPKDYGEGAGAIYSTPGMHEETFQDTDKDAANRYLASPVKKRTGTEP